MTFERSIKSGYIKETGEIIESDVYFKNKQEGEKIRTEFNRGNITFGCLCCKQDLIPSKSKKRTFYLKHYPNSEYCELKEESLPNEEQEIFSKVLIAKESPRHIFLKNKIGGLLRKTKDVFEVKIDDFYIFNIKGEKRKPDIYCKYLDKEIVFEIQLSNLSQKYILGRHDFYKNKGIYLIWILDNFDVEGTSTTDLDIKYLSKHQNYFRFIDSNNIFLLNCKFKQTFLNSSNNFFDKWKEINISLDKLKFDNNNKAVYFYNFLKNKEELELLQRRNYIKIEQEREAKENKKIQEEVAYKIHDFIDNIAIQKRKYLSDFTKLWRELKKFNDNEIEILNSRLNINSKNRLIKWLKNASNSDYEFFEFLLLSDSIDIDINKKDSNGNGVVWYLFMNDEIHLSKKLKYLILFFKRGYIFSDNDDKILSAKYSKKTDYQQISFACYSANSTPKWLIDKLFENTVIKVLCIIQSCLNREIFGFGFQNEVQLLDYALNNFPDYWQFIEHALKASSNYDNIMELDKRGTIKRKLEKLKNYDEDDYDREFAHLFMEFYPELT